MSQRHYRILAVIDPLPSGAAMVRQLSAIIHEYRPRNVLWVTLCDDISMGFESCHYPFLTPMEWVERTEAQLATRLQEVLRCQGVEAYEFRLMTGSPNQVMADLSNEWGADLILTSNAHVGKITGHDGLEWLFPPIPLRCAVQTIPAHSPWPKIMKRWLQNWSLYPARSHH
ncbi:MAG: universal stress protein [Magnetococcus sp. YQC-5]